MNNRTFIPSLRLSATLLLVGQLLYIVVTQFHADGPANNHAIVFAEYARSGNWTAAHVGQFLAGIPRPIGYLMGLSGLACLVQGWLVGAEGLSGLHSTLICGDLGSERCVDDLAGRGRLADAGCAPSRRPMKPRTAPTPSKLSCSPGDPATLSPAGGAVTGRCGWLVAGEWNTSSVASVFPSVQVLR